MPPKLLQYSWPFERTADSSVTTEGVMLPTFLWSLTIFRTITDSNVPVKVWCHQNWFSFFKKQRRDATKVALIRSNFQDNHKQRCDTTKVALSHQLFKTTTDSKVSAKAWCHQNCFSLFKITTVSSVASQGVMPPLALPKWSVKITPATQNNDELNDYWGGSTELKIIHVESKVTEL